MKSLEVAMKTINKFLVVLDRRNDDGFCRALAVFAQTPAGDGSATRRAAICNEDSRA